MQTLNAEQVERMRERDDLAVTLVNVLPHQAFRQEHITGSINIPKESDGFAQQVEEAAGGKDRPVIVYCASLECDASPKAARKLERAGFSEVYDFEGGMKEWRETQHPVETGA